MAKTRGEPGAVKAARRVREEAPGKRQAATPAPRPEAHLTQRIADTDNPAETASALARVLAANLTPAE